MLLINKYFNLEFGKYLKIIFKNINNKNLKRIIFNGIDY